VVRTAIEALAAVLGGTNSLAHQRLDETLACPPTSRPEIALRTQQVIMEETGVVNVADPLGGSWYVEALTDRIEEEAERIFARIIERARGGCAPRVGPSRPASSAASRTATSPRDRRLGLRPPAGAGEGRQAHRRVNAHTATVTKELEILPHLAGGRAGEQRATLSARRSSRDASTVDAALAAMVACARTSENLMPAMLDAARAEATLGEICDALKAEWGIYGSRRGSRSRLLGVAF
jgi:methylmalonyl-CoA mutase N-terminal domain/subunit